MLQKSKKIKEIEAVRVTAALMVAFQHALFIFNIDGINNIWERPLNLQWGLQAILTKLLLVVFNGDLAVTFFFVISGLVLGLSIEKKDINIPNSIAFVVKRFLRLYPVYITVIGTTAVYWYLFHDYQKYDFVSDWFFHLFKNRPNLIEIWENVIFSKISLSAVTVPLKVELLGVFFMPILVYIKRKTNRITDILFFTALFLIGVSKRHWFARSFLFYFYLGLMLGKWGKGFIRWVQDRIHLGMVIVPVIIILSISLSLTDNFAMTKLIQVLLVWFFLGYIIYGRKSFLKKIFNSAKLQSFGKLTYSFYLWHFLILYIESKMFINIFGDKLIGNNFHLGLNIFLGLISIFITVPVAFLTYVCIEKPTLLISNRILKSS